MNYGFAEAVAEMAILMSGHPSWKRYVEGTPLAHDLPVMATMLMLRKIDEAVGFSSEIAK